MELKAKQGGDIGIQVDIFGNEYVIETGIDKPEQLTLDLALKEKQLLEVDKNKTGG